MALQTSGAISLSQIQTEFGGSNPISMSEYYAAADGVPASGLISLSDFYGTSNLIDLSSTATPTTINGESTLQEMLVSDYISSGGSLSIPSSWWVWSDDITVAALTIDIPCTIINYGKIIGRGGNGGNGTSGAGQAGGPAIKINSGVTGVSITNASGAFIAGGGGGGGGGTYSGGGGGAGGGSGGRENYSNTAGGAGGIINAVGSNGGQSYEGGRGYGGGAGGGGGTSIDVSGADGGGSGGGGGRVLTLSPSDENTTGAYGGAGGVAADYYIDGQGNFIIRDTGRGDPGGYNGEAANLRGSTGHSRHGGGGGGWGANGSSGNGGSGGAGGAAIDDSGNTYSLTDNGTIYGAT